MKSALLGLLVGAASGVFRPQSKDSLLSALTAWENDAAGAKAQYDIMDTWDVSSITNMSFLFYGVSLDVPIGRWNTGAVTTMEAMFHSASTFNQPIGSWNIGAVTAMDSMFYNAVAFVQPIGRWNTGAVTAMKKIFHSATAFNQGISRWNTGAVTALNDMFSKATAFNQPIGSWNIGAVTAMHSMFDDAAAFNQPIGSWNAGAVTALDGVFCRATAFNQGISNWNTGAVTSIAGMFQDATAFNQPIGSWNTSAVTSMAYVFQDAAAFNQPIGSWNLGAVKFMKYIFASATAFNQEVGKWDVAQVTTMDYMLLKATSFNQEVGKWNTGRVTCMQSMFKGAAEFDQMLDHWDVSQVGSDCMLHMFSGSSWNRCSPCSYGIKHIASVIIVFVACVAVAFIIAKLRSSSKSYLIWRLQFLSRRAGYRVRLRSLVTWQKTRVASTESFSIGREVHHRIVPERWCITREDLDLFENEVYLAWKDGEIPNHDQFPNPFHDDVTVGPTMYQVNEHFIKPVTAQYGGMSFALLLHPEGLECDAFATHAWAEGVFEFCDKVRRGWPHGCRNMYVCFLSNPQNLDISDLLDVPIERSPFALALSKASHMLVVPNRFLSIYSRLWCCYEAFVAVTLNKTIVLPPAKILVGWVRHRLYICTVIGCVAFVCTRLLFKPRLHALMTLKHIAFAEGHERFCIHLVALLLTFAVPLVVALNLATRYPSAESRKIVCLHGIASVAAAGCASMGIELFAAPVPDFYEELRVMWQIAGAIYVLFACAIAILTSVMTLSCRSEEARALEASQLSFESLLAADCSNDSDRRKILQALMFKEANVELALVTLMSQGMSTAELRAVDMSYTSQGYKDFGAMLFGLVLWPVYFGMAAVAAMHFEEQKVGRRTLVMSIFAGLVLYYLCAWASVYSDPDLLNLIMHASVVGWCGMLLTGFLLGLWGIAGGAAYGACYIVCYHHLVRKEQLQRLCSTLKPVTILCFAFSSWEVFSTAVLGIGCECIWQDIAGILLFSVAFVCASCLFPRWILQQFAGGLGIGALFVVWICFHSAAIIANMSLSMNHKFFFADRQILHKFISQRFHYAWGVLHLIGACGVLVSIAYFHHRRKHRIVVKRQATIEMQLWHP